MALLARTLLNSPGSALVSGQADRACTPERARGARRAGDHACDGAGTRCGLHTRTKRNRKRASQRPAAPVDTTTDSDPPAWPIANRGWTSHVSAKSGREASDPGPSIKGFQAHFRRMSGRVVGVRRGWYGGMFQSRRSCGWTLVRTRPRCPKGTEAGSRICHESNFFERSGNFG